MEKTSLLFVQSISDLKSYIPILGAFIGVIGTLTYQLIFRKSDSKKKTKEELNDLNGMLDSFLRKVEYAIELSEDMNPIELRKDFAIRNLKEQFFKLDIFSNLIEEIGEKERFFYNKKQYKYIKEINDILWQINLFMYQVDDPREQKEEVLINWILNNNIRVYDEIKSSCSKLRILDGKLER